MAFTTASGVRIAGIESAVPVKNFNNVIDTRDFSQEEVKKVVAMAGVNNRRIAGDLLCSSDLCTAAAVRLFENLHTDRNTIDALIMITQTPDYILPSTSCVIHKKLGLSTHCAAFDVNQGCSGYPYGLWLASTILSGTGFKKVLLLHGDTPSRYADKADRSVSLLFGDAGSATMLESAIAKDAANWNFALHTDGQGCEDIIVEGGGFRDRFCEDQRSYYVKMKGSNVFKFTIERVPDLIKETLEGSGKVLDDIDYFIFHQSNKFIINYLVNKMKIPQEKVPLTLREYGNTGGPSIPLTITLGGLIRPHDRPLTMMLLGYGVGLSWAAALITLDPDAVLAHSEVDEQGRRRDA